MGVRDGAHRIACRAMDGIHLPPRAPRLPAEWEPVGAVLLAWPHGHGDWAPYLSKAQACYRSLAAAIARHARVIVLADDADEVAGQIAALGIPAEQVEVRGDVPCDDTWIRDFGPLTVLRGGSPICLDFGFNGWGLKFAAADDNRATRRLHAAGGLGQAALETVGLILEGGSIESDGAGTILTTESCLLSANRNPHLDRCGVEAALAAHLGAKRVLWLAHGHLAGDDTDAHIDTIARLCPHDTILYVRCDDPADQHHAAFARMEAELRALRTAAGASYRLVALPWAAPRFCPLDDHRIPATYANVLFVNGAVLVPTYDEPARDAAALSAVAEACPGMKIEGVDCSALIWQHGSLHCATMQIPQEAFA
jgi:agmatine deiminase